MVSSAIGEPLHTEKSRLDPYHFGDTKVKIEIQLDSEPPKLVEVRDDQGNAVRIQVEYPSLPPRCLNCGKFGHLINRCLKPIVKRNKDSDQTSHQQVRMVSTSTKISLETEEADQEDGEIEIVNDESVEKKVKKKKSKRKGRSRSRAPSIFVDGQTNLVSPVGNPGEVKHVEAVAMSKTSDATDTKNLETVEEQSGDASSLSDKKEVTQDVSLEEEESEPRTPSGDENEEEERLWFKHSKAVRKAIRQELWHSTMKKQPPRSVFSIRTWGSTSRKMQNL